MLRGRKSTIGIFCYFGKNRGSHWTKIQNCIQKLLAIFKKSSPNISSLNCTWKSFEIGNMYSWNCMMTKKNLNCLICHGFVFHFLDGIIEYGTLCGYGSRSGAKNYWLHHCRTAAQTAGICWMGSVLLFSEKAKLLNAGLLFAWGPSIKYVPIYFRFSDPPLPLAHYGCYLGLSY